MASNKRELPISNEPEGKKAKVSDAEPSEPSKSAQRVVLNPADCDLDFNVEVNGLQGSALHEQGFAYCWSGARANVGITGGKYCFGCKIISNQPVDMEDTPLDQQHLCRLGISRGDDSVGNLGETEHSLGFGGTGKFSMAGKFLDYGEKFGVGDTIICTVNLQNKPMAFIGFSKNGKWLGTAKHFNAGPDGLGVVDSPVKKRQWESAVFPHVLLKNVVVQLQFSIEDGLVPEEGYKPWACALDTGNAIMGPTFSNTRECEVMMMVGLPASGKTTWAEKWVKEHPEKRYLLLGTNLALDQMKVPGLLRKQNYGERFDRLMDCATGIFNTLLSRASKTPRNFMIDQTNVYKSARKRKLKPFANFRKIAVVIFPKPEELKFRAHKRFQEMGKEVPPEAVNEMLANYVLPMSKDMPGADEYFDQVVFTELNRAESQRHLDEMKINVNLKRDVSPYSHESSVQSYDSHSTKYSRESYIQSYNSPSMENQGSLPGHRGYWRGSYPSQPPSSLPHENYSTPPRDLLPTDFKHYGSYPAYGTSQPPLSVPYENYSTPVRDFLPTVFKHYGSPAYGTSVRNVNQIREATPGDVGDPYQTYGAGDSYGYPNIDDRSFLSGGRTDSYGSGMVEPYARTFSSNSHGGYTSVPGGLQADMPAPRQPACWPGTTTYGSPNGTPSPRPSYGSLPTSVQHPGGYVPPRPRYY
ncbi:unnamed protein product [Ilex paraguariensis]|uniref:SPRY domain-containing protein n=1 Tax=Ilex paraguariensis TaxID=185542 RepID=A0ABC8RI66_9AQUA